MYVVSKGWKHSTVVANESYDYVETPNRKISMNKIIKKASKQTTQLLEAIAEM